MSVFPALARWLPDDTPPLNRRIVARASLDVALVETPLGSNRHPVWDAYARRFGSPLGSYYCALAAGAWFQDAGARVPGADVGAVASWWAMGKARGTITQQPRPGAAVIYSLAGTGHPDHMGICAADAPLVLSIEANTTFKRQCGSDRNGEGCTVGDIDVAHLLGYLLPEPAPAVASA